jgi:glutamine cyclotransferase
MTIPKQYFAEGLERVGDKIFQLTWQEGFCFVYDKTTFTLVEQFRYSGEGWGLTFDGEHLILSDGSATLRFFDPKTFKQKRKLDVMDRESKTKKPILIKKLNELEFIRGEIWANVWQTTNIVRIDPKTGNVIGWIDCSGFVPEEYRKEHAGPVFERNNVLNGIAFDPATNRVFITGKNWSVLYELQIINP